MIKRILALSIVLVLVGCNTSNSEDGESTAVEPVNEDAEETDANVESIDTDEPDASGEETTNQSSDHVFVNLVDETTFMDEEGLEAWEDYQFMLSQATIADYIIEGQSSGSSMEEVDAVFQSIEDRDHVIREEVELSNDEKLVLYRYTVDETSDYSDVADFLVELTYYYRFLHG